MCHIWVIASRLNGNAMLYVNFNLQRSNIKNDKRASCLKQRPYNIGSCGLVKSAVYNRSCDTFKFNQTFSVYNTSIRIFVLILMNIQFETPSKWYRKKPRRYFGSFR